LAECSMQQSVVPVLLLSPICSWPLCLRKQGHVVRVAAAFNGVDTYIFAVDSYVPTLHSRTKSTTVLQLQHPSAMQHLSRLSPSAAEAACHPRLTTQQPQLYVSRCIAGQPITWLLAAASCEWPQASTLNATAQPTPHSSTHPPTPGLQHHYHHPSTQPTPPPPAPLASPHHHLPRCVAVCRSSTAP